MKTMTGFEMDALLRRQQELVTQLRALILPPLRDATDGSSADLAVNLFDDVIDCSARVMSMLPSVGAADRGPAAASNLISNGGAGEGQEQKPMMYNDVGRKRRRTHDTRSRSLVTIAPHYDGHHWRKYGQKNINGRAHARSYYRCAYTERGCSATKTIQEQERHGILNCEEEAAKYTVVYYGHHTCQDENSVGLTPSGEMAGAAADFQKFDHWGDLDVPALLEVLDDSQLNWDIIC